MIKKTASGKFKLYTKDGKKPLQKKAGTKAEALKRERQVQYFKHKGGK